MQSFYLSIYEVLIESFNGRNTIRLIFYFFQNQKLPSLQWIKSSNDTHGYIYATVDFTVGPKPINATGYRARTLNDRRYVHENDSRLMTCILLNRRDFRLFIADPTDPTKPKANPVIWFTTPLVTVISFILDYDQLLIY